MTTVRSDIAPETTAIPGLGQLNVEDLAGQTVLMRIDAAVPANALEALRDVKLKTALASLDLLLSSKARGPNPNGSGITVSHNVAFSIANALTLINSSSVAFNNLGGSSPGIFDWGLSFFFGRTVFVGIEGQSSAAGTGPYWAY